MTRCLIVDDSPAFRSVLSEILRADPTIQVVGEAGDGQEAIELTRKLRPDVVTMDVRMPRKDGLTAIGEIMAEIPTPIVVICAGGRDENLGIDFQALKLGAVEVLEKPDRETPDRFRRQADRIRQTVRAMSTVKIVRRASPRKDPIRPPDELRRVHGCVAIAASTGGPAALAKVLGALPKEFPLPVLVVQHIVEGFVGGLTLWLASQCKLPVKVAEDGESIRGGTIYIAPDGKHMMVARAAVKLDDGPPVRSLKPSATVMLTSVAREYAQSAAGVILTGMGADGATGLKLLKERGGVTMAQSQATCVVYGMPREAIEAGAVEQVLDLEDIGPALCRLAGLETSGKPLPALGKKRLLLVDDTETILQVEQALLGPYYELLIARNGKEAVEAAEKHQPDAILMDYTMPVMTGGEALRAMRQLPKTKKIPVIMVTSETEPSLIQSCWDSGCQDFIPKPIDGPQLLRAVRKWAPG